MENVLPNEGIIAIPKDKLPPEFVEWIRTMQETANEKLQKADRTLRKIHGLIKAMQTAVQLTYDHQQLGKVEFEATTEWYLENSSRTTAFIVTYGRLFTESKGTYKIERSKIPDELGDIHDEVMRMRNKLYAHNGDHESSNTYPEIGFDGTEFEIRLGMTIDVHVGGNNHWDALVTFVNEHIHDQLYKNIERLKEETGTVWRTSEGG